ncbi:MAG: STAS domain-containing protein [Thermodesulfobacterium sp.]|jgi:ABC-type transporter Mla MlaB component|nr:STAS domain-containing protein [Thermodesulfobacterium sp.]
MPVEIKKKEAKLMGVVGIEEAEELFNFLVEKKKPKVDLSELEHLHTACLQLLLVFKPEIIAFPQDKELALWFL